MARTGELRALSMTSALLLGVSGCMIPVYHQPQGFSSTYYRHLQQSAPVLTGAHVAPADLAKAVEKSKEDVVSEATPSAEDNAETPPVTEKSGSWWSWIRRPISSRPNASNDSDEEEDSASEDEARREPTAERR